MNQTGKRSLLIVTLSLERGGTERHLLQILPELRELGFVPEVFLMNHPGPLASAAQEAGIRLILPWWHDDVKRSTLPRLVRPARLAVVSVQLFLYLLFRRPRIVHFFLPASYLIGAPIAILAAIRRKMMSRRSLNNYQKAHPTAAWLERRLHPRMQAILGNSRAVVEELVKDERAPRARVGLVYNGIDAAPPQDPSPEAVVNARRRHAIADDAVLVTVVANLIAYKGHADLFQALHLAADRLPDKLIVALAGRDDGAGDDLRRQVTACGLDEIVRFLGPVDQVEALLAASDVFALPSHEEGFSNAVLEAMRARLAIVVTDVGGNAEAVSDGTSGMIVPPRDPPALAAALTTVLEDEELRHRLGTAARARVEEEFSLRHCIDQYAAIYRAVADDRELTVLPPFQWHRRI